MLTITHDYRVIHKKEMSENFFIRKHDVRKIWDRDEGRIGILFRREYSSLEYKIELDGKDRKLLASDLIKIIFSPGTRTLTGKVVAV